MIPAGQYHTLSVLRTATVGVYLDDGAEGILLPNRFVPPDTRPGDALSVFIYHDSEDRRIATTQKPKGILGDFVKLKVVSTRPEGAFMDWGLMKDLFIPRSHQIQRMLPGGEYLVRICLDAQTGRLFASEKLTQWLSNRMLTVKENERVSLTVYRRTDLGYLMIINNLHTGMAYHSEIFRPMEPGQKHQGVIKRIYPEDNKIDLLLGDAGYEKTQDASQTILNLLNEHGGQLPYHDNTPPDVIYSVFRMSKKTFKMTLGKLYREKKIQILPDGIRLLP